MDSDNPETPPEEIEATEEIEEEKPELKSPRQAGTIVKGFFRRPGKILDAAKLAGKAVQKWTLGLAAAIAGISAPVLATCLVILIISTLILGGFGCLAIRTGYLGKTLPQRAGKDDPNVQKLIAATKTSAGKEGIAGVLAASKDSKKLEFLNQRDLEYVESGQIDKRLAASLVYLVDHHQHIRVSHIVSGYENLKTNVESGRFHDKQIINNISAHKDGLAMDIDEIDYVKQQCKCGDNIPVKVAWQKLSEKPIENSDALSKITKASDLLLPEVRAALEKFGVKGLGDAGAQSALQSGSGDLASIKSPDDLTSSKIISALNRIGITGIDNTDLQSGLKKIEAIKAIGELDLTDLNALASNQSAKDLFGQIGINLDQSTIDSLKKFQAGRVLANINSLDDLSSPQVQQALAALGVDPNDPKFKDSLAKLQQANLLMNWDGNVSDPAFQKALNTFGLEDSVDLDLALMFIGAAQGTLKSPPGTMTSDISTIEGLEKMGVFVDDPDLQKVIQQYRGAYNLLNWQGNVPDAAFFAYAQDAGLNTTTDQKALWDKFLAARDLINFTGDPNDPRILADLQRLGVSPSEIDKIREQGAAQYLLEKGGLSAEYQTVLTEMKFWETVLSKEGIAAFRDAATEEALRQLGLEDYKTLIANLNDIAKLVITDLENQAADKITEALIRLDVPAAAIDAYFQLQNIQALASIKSPLDLARPDVQQALSNLGVSSDSLAALGKAGSVYALTQIKSPQDLLQPQNLAALNDLGIIDVDAEFLGDVAAIQHLLTIDSFEDLFNPQTILALNQLGLVALSGPVAAALMAVSFIDQMFGLGLFGSCNGNTNCYEPTAKANIAKVISELLQMPYDLGDKDSYRPTQIITYQLDFIREKIPDLDTKLNELYWPNRPANVGLFEMPESWGSIHIAY